MSHWLSNDDQRNRQIKRHKVVLPHYDYTGVLISFRPLTTFDQMAKISLRSPFVFARIDPRGRCHCPKGCAPCPYLAVVPGKLKLMPATLTYLYCSSSMCMRTFHALVTSTQTLCSRQCLVIKIYFRRTASIGPTEHRDGIAKPSISSRRGIAICFVGYVALSKIKLVTLIHCQDSII